MDKFIPYLVPVLSALVSVTGAFYSAKSDAKADIAGVRAEIAEKYVRRDEMKDVRDKLTQVAEDVSRIRGIVEAQSNFKALRTK